MVDSWRSDEVFLFIHFDRQPRRWGDKLYPHGSVRQSPAKVSEASPRRGSCVIRMSPLFLRQCDVANRKRRHNDDSLPSLTRLTNNNLAALVVVNGCRLWANLAAMMETRHSHTRCIQIDENEHTITRKWIGGALRWLPIGRRAERREKPKINKKTQIVQHVWKTAGAANRIEPRRSSSRRDDVFRVCLFSHRFSFERRQN